MDISQKFAKVNLYYHDQQKHISHKTSPKMWNKLEINGPRISFFYPKRLTVAFHLLACPPGAAPFCCLREN